MKRLAVSTIALFVALVAFMPFTVLAQTPTDPGSIVNATTNNGPTPAVLGAQTCATRTGIEGYIFIDANSNQERDSGESGIINARLQVFDPADMNTALITVMSDQDGKWVGQLCPGTYQVKIDQIPSNLRLLENDTKQITVSTATLTNVNFRASEKSATQSWIWWVVIPFVLLVLAVAMWMALRRRKREL